MRRFVATAIALAVCALVRAAPAAEGVPVRMRVLTYNCGSGACCDLSPWGVSRIADEIIDNRVDVAGLTEYDIGTDFYDKRDLVGELLAHLSARGYAMHSYTVPVIRYSNGFQVHTILSRWAIEESERHVVGGAMWEVQKATVSPVAGLSVDIFNSHIPCGGRERYEPLRRCFEYVAASENPHVYMGDFNFGARDSNFMDTASSVGLVHAGFARHGEPTLSVGPGAYMVSPLPRGHQIDHIFVSQGVRVVETYTNYTSVADHWPVIADLEFSAPLLTPDLGDNVRHPQPARAWDDAMDAYRRRNFASAAAQLADLYKVEPGGERADFYLYSAGCMQLLAGDVEAARATFERGAHDFPDRYWGVWCLQRLSFLLEDAGEYRDAAAAVDMFLVGYYDVVHDYVADATLRPCLQRLVRLEARLGGDVTYDELIRDFAQRYEGRGIARACHWFLAEALLDSDIHAWYEHYVKVGVEPRKLSNNHVRNTKIALALARLGDYERGDAVLYGRCLTDDVPRPYQRNALGTYWKLRYPEEYAIDLREGEPVTVALSGPRHLVISGDGADEPSGVLTLLARAGRLEISVRVTDDVHYNPMAAEGIWEGDSIQLAFDPGLQGGDHYDADDVELGLARTSSGVVRHFWKTNEERAWDELRGDVVQQGDETIYHVEVPYDALGVSFEEGATVAFSFAVNDNDGSGRRAVLEWSPGISFSKAPGMYPVIRLSK